MTDLDHQHHQIAEFLGQRGWTIPAGPNIASKSFDTAVGARTAHVWLSPRADDAGNRALRAEYLSEGRNVLACYSEVFPAAADSDFVARIAARFVGNVETAVRESYAARLLQGAMADAPDEFSTSEPEFDVEGPSPAA